MYVISSFKIIDYVYSAGSWFPFLYQGCCMKNFKIIIFIILLSCLAGCATKQTMPPIKYEKPIRFHINKNAKLTLETGQYHEGVKTTHMPSAPYGSGLVGAAGVLLAATATSLYQQKYPSKPSHFIYGEKEQDTFMNSFKEVLKQNSAFINVDFTQNFKTVAAAKDILIKVFFKNSRIASDVHNHRITLTVQMTIITNSHPPFQRTYLMQSSGNKSFTQQQTEISEQLMENLLVGIEEWHKNVK